MTCVAFVLLRNAKTMLSSNAGLSLIMVIPELYSHQYEYEQFYECDDYSCLVLELGSFIPISIYRDFVSLDGESFQFL